MIIKDSILVKYCKKGIKKFCNQIYKRHNRLVASIAYGIVRDADMVEDVVQEVFLRFFDGIKKYREESSLKNWLGRIATNYSIQITRSAAYRYRGYFKSVDGIVERETGGGKSIQQQIQIQDESITGNALRQVCTKEEIRLVEEQIIKLSPKLRETLSLKYAGYTNKEISEILKIKEATVRSRIHNALKIILN